jgi:hypothetical protein
MAPSLLHEFRIGNRTVSIAKLFSYPSRKFWYRVIVNEYRSFSNMPRRVADKSFSTLRQAERFAKRFM